MSLLVLAAGGAGYVVYDRLEGNIHTDPAVRRQLEKYESQRPPAGARGTQNVLLIGSDDRSGANAGYGREKGRRSDTTILLHLPADHRSATAVSIPRDLVVHRPECTGAGGRPAAARSTQFNAAFQVGGAACTIRTVEAMTGIRVDHYVSVDFNGFKRMVDAVDGVEVCLPHAVHDKEAHLALPAGRHLLDGEQALGYVRVRKGLGDGSDTQRMGRQQRFLAALVKKVRSNGVLLNPTKLYPVMDAATRALTTDEGLASLRGLYGLVRSTRDITPGKIRFLTVPRRPYRLDPNRDELAEPDAKELFRRLRKDLPVSVQPSSSSSPGTPEASGAATGGSASPGASAPSSTPDASLTSPDGAPTFHGTTADRGVCS
ncbi:LCP family protein [Streptomyces sp. NPDC059740]|uniref:LCP family protein n=1 Tax=Streptomyces sp. NPDC059740 TaxID=3346926 RepID=UPI0036579229